MLIDNILEALSSQKIEVVPNPVSVQKIYYNQSNFSEKLKEVQKLRNQGLAAVFISDESRGNG